jgi:hypothetical protein
MFISALIAILLAYVFVHSWLHIQFVLIPKWIAKRKASGNPVYDYRTVQTRILSTEWKTSFGKATEYTAQVHNGKDWEKLKTYGGIVSVTKRAKEVYRHDSLDLGIEKAKIDFFMRQLERQEATIVSYVIEHPTKTEQA